MFKSTKSEAYKMVLEILLTLVFPESDNDAYSKQHKWIQCPQNTEGYFKSY